MNWIYYVDLFGTCVFAVSGVLTAIQKKFEGKFMLLLALLVALFIWF